MDVTARDFEHVQSRFEARVRELCSERGIAFERVVKAVRIVDMLHEVVPK